MKKIIIVLFVLAFYVEPTISLVNFRAGGLIEREYPDGIVILQIEENIINLPPNENSVSFSEAEINDPLLRATLSSFGVIEINRLYETKTPFPLLKNYFELKIGDLDPKYVAEQIIIKNPQTILNSRPDYYTKLAIIPNDLLFSYQWGLHNIGTLPGLPGTSGAVDADIDAPEGWDIETGNHVVIAVVDSGIDYTHPDLAANIWTNPGEIPNNNIDDDSNGYIDDYYGYDFCASSSPTSTCATNDSDPIDGYGHGTHVAGTIAAITNNNIGVSGVCWNCKLMALKIFNSAGGGTVTKAIKAIVYATDNGAHITSNSWSSLNPNIPDLEAVFNYAKSNGVALIAAAGNSASSVAVAPAKYSTVISVAALNTVGTNSIFSNFGPWVDVAAPGGEGCPLGLLDILSTVPTYPFTIQSNACYTGNFNGNYGYLAGTSMAAPHVTGIAGLLLSKNPTLTVDELYTLLRSGVDNMPATLYTIYFGEGRVSANKSLSYNLPAVAFLDQSLDGAIATGMFPVYGSAYGPNFNSYLLEIGTGIYPSTFTTMLTSTTPVVNGSLGIIDMSMFSSGERYTLRLTVQNNQGEVYRDTTLLNVGCIDLFDIPGYGANSPNIFTNTILCPGTYSADGILIIGADNIILDCNNAVLISSAPTLGYGVYIPVSLHVHNATIKNCILKDFYYGIALFNSANNTIENNVLINNTRGIAVGRPLSTFVPPLVVRNTIRSNTLINNQIGLLVPPPYISSNNLIINNNLISNVLQAQFSNLNTWSTPQTGGNYWNNYAGVDNNLDSYGDTPYIINSNNTDSLPLIYPKFLSIIGSSTLGNSFKLKIRSPLTPNKPYLILAAHSNTPPIILSDGRRVYLQYDQLLDFTLLNPNSQYFQNSFGILDNNGLATATITIPNYPFLLGLPLYFGFVVIDPSASSGVSTISHTIKTIIQ